jgi:glycosyltransferase involved in cell wall biosynthesis
VTGRSPLVSLIMPVWSPRPDWLRAGVESALAQSGCDIELVVVDDGSAPPVAELLANVRDDRLRLLRVEHGRVSRARNAGVEAARGSWLRFVDYDDVLVEDSTAHLLAVADRNEGSIAYGATAVCDDELRALSVISSALQGRVEEACLLGRFDTTIHSLLFPRRVVDAIGPWEPSIVVSQDWDYALRAFEVAHVRGDQRIATRYRTHERMNSRDVREGIRGYRMVVERYFQRHPERRGSGLERRARVGYHVFAAVQSARALGEYRSAARHLARAIALDPGAAFGAARRAGALPFKPAAAAVGRALRRQEI